MCLGLSTALRVRPQSQSARSTNSAFLPLSTRPATVRTCDCGWCSSRVRACRHAMSGAESCHLHSHPSVYLGSRSPCIYRHIWTCISERSRALGAVAAVMATSPSADDSTLTAAYDRVRETANAISEAMHSSGVDDGSSATTSQSHAEPGTREYCIERYADCQDNAPRSYNRDNCQPCMERCIGDEDFRWPEEEVRCNYAEHWRRRPWRRRHDIKF